VKAKQIILAAAALGFTIPSMTVIGALAVAAKKSDWSRKFSLEQNHHKAVSDLAGCGCPFCRSTFQSESQRIKRDI
jgi:hypothetical protein